MAQGGRVFVATTKELDAVGPIASCDAIRTDLVRQSVAADGEAGLDDQARRDKSEALRTRSETEFLRCFARNASRRSGFAAATKAAQALIERLPQR